MILVNELLSTHEKSYFLCRLAYWQQLNQFNMFKPTDLYYLISLQCNQRCSKCSHWKRTDGEKEIEASDFIKAFIDYSGSFRELCIVGGEPLIFKKDVIEITHYFSDQGVRVVIITNGILMDKHFIDVISNKNTHIIISIDTLDPDEWVKFRGVDSFHRTMGNVRYAIDNLEPSKLSIQSVLAVETEYSLKAVNQFCEENSIHHSIQHYISEGFNGNWTEIKKDHQVKPSQTCHAAHRNASVLPNGDVYTCFQQNLMKGCELPLGNIKKGRFEEIIQSDYTNYVLDEMATCNLPCKVLKCNQE